MSHTTRRMWTLIWGLVVPHSFVLVARALHNRMFASRVLKSFNAQLDGQGDGAPRAFDYTEGLGLLVARGCDEEAARSGSIQDGSLRFIAKTIEERLPGTTPLNALHVGNFVGLSLASLTSTLVRRNPSSTVVSIDPNIPHLGVQHPQDHVLALLTHFGLQHNSLLICGYTLEKVLGNDALRMTDYDPLSAFAGEVACEGALESLNRLPVSFSVAVIDGNHDASYLRRELQVVDSMLDQGGLLFLDDVSAVWQGIRELFKELGGDSSSSFEQVGYDGRVGALRKRVAVPA